MLEDVAESPEITKPFRAVSEFRSFESPHETLEITSADLHSQVKKKKELILQHIA